MLAAVCPAACGSWLRRAWRVRQVPPTRGVRQPSTWTLAKLLQSCCPLRAVR